jgi:hypothetical protein
MADVIEKLKRCDLLIELLSVERVEWESAIGQLREGGELAVGDMFMNAMHLAYLSARHARVLADRRAATVLSAPQSMYSDLLALNIDPANIENVVLMLFCHTSRILIGWRRRSFEQHEHEMAIFKPTTQRLMCHNQGLHGSNRPCTWRPRGASDLHIRRENACETSRLLH